MNNQPTASPAESTPSLECVPAVERRALVDVGAICKQGAWYRVLDWEKLSQRARECIGEINIRNGLKVKFRR
jgi:hypothetical protein